MAEDQDSADLYYDTEFIDDGKTIDLVSIGITGPDGREYYAISSEFSMRKLWRNPWLVENVSPHLPLRTRRILSFKCVYLDKKDPRVKPREQIAREVSDFIGQYQKPCLWAYYGAYDHVVLAQLWGPIKYLPSHVPMWTADIRQECVRLGNPRLPEQTGAQHDALADAQHNRVKLDYLRRVEAEKSE